jgi:hypothetical protein
VSAHVIFYISAATSLIGLFFTIAFIADVTTLSLLETEKRWDAIKTGSLYVGPATEVSHIRFSFVYQIHPFCNFSFRLSFYFVAYVLVQTHFLLGGMGPEITPNERLQRI